MVNAPFLKSWTVMDYEQDNEALTITARHNLTPPSYPRCGVVGAKFYQHASAEVEYAEAPVCRLRRTIKVKTKDLECAKTFMQPLLGMTGGCMMTKWAVQYIERCTGNQTWAEIAKGRGYDFEVIRARVLLDIRKVNPDELITCGGCGVRFSIGMPVAIGPLTVGRGRKRREVTLCPQCRVS